MFDFLENVVEWILLHLNIANRPFLSSIVKGIAVAILIFTVMRVGRLFQPIRFEYWLEDIQTCAMIGCMSFILALLIELIKKIEG